jgi:hypothetical protein
MRLSAVDLRQVVKRGLPIAFVRREFTSYCCPKLCGAICRDSISAPAWARAFRRFVCGSRRMKHLQYVTAICGSGASGVLARIASVHTVGNWLHQFTRATVAPDAARLPLQGRAQGPRGTSRRSAPDDGTESKPIVAAGRQFAYANRRLPTASNPDGTTTGVVPDAGIVRNRSIIA